MSRANCMHSDAASQGCGWWQGCGAALPEKSSTQFCAVKLHLSVAAAMDSGSQVEDSEACTAFKSASMAARRRRLLAFDVQASDSFVTSRLTSRLRTCG